MAAAAAVNPRLFLPGTLFRYVLNAKLYMTESGFLLFHKVDIKMGFDICFSCLAPYYIYSLTHKYTRRLPFVQCNVQMVRRDGGGYPESGTGTLIEEDAAGHC